MLMGAKFIKLCAYARTEGQNRAWAQHVHHMSFRRYIKTSNQVKLHIRDTVQSLFSKRQHGTKDVNESPQPAATEQAAFYVLLYYNAILSNSMSDYT